MNIQRERMGPLLPTTVDSQVLLQMVLVFEGLATFCAFELAVASSLVQQLVLRKRGYLHELLTNRTEEEFGT